MPNHPHAVLGSIIRKLIDEEVVEAQARINFTRGGRSCT